MQAAPRTMIVEISLTSHMRCLDCHVAVERRNGGNAVTARAFLDAWALRHNEGDPWPGAENDYSVCMAVPSSHALLFCGGHWDSYCVPYLVKTARARALGRKTKQDLRTKLQSGNSNVTSVS